MLGRFVKQLLVVFVVLFVWSFAWHGPLFGGFYETNLSQIARYASGKVAPLMPYLALGNLLIALGFAMYVPPISKGTKEFVKNGAWMGLVTFGSFAVMSHALFAGWNSGLMLADTAYSIVAGAIGGWVLSRFARS